MSSLRTFGGDKRSAKKARLKERDGARGACILRKLVRLPDVGVIILGLLGVEHIPDSMRGHRRTMLAVVRLDGLALEHASEQLRGDRDVVLAAVRQDGHALMHASPQVKGDREVVALAAITTG